MKKKLPKIIISVILLILIIVLLVVIILKSSNSNKQPTSDYTTNNNNEEEEVSTNIDQNIYSVKDFSLNPEEQNKIIKSTEELKNYLSSAYPEDNLEELISKYDDYYFEDRVLALSYVKLTNNKQIPNVVGLNINENSLEIQYVEKEVENESSFSYIILVETDQNIENITSTKL